MTANKKLHATCGMEFLGMGNGEEVAFFPMPNAQAAGRLSLSTHEGWSFPPISMNLD
ncbi:hypothetical protein [Nostoc sp.]|uniref:hypothetical protein n=1 Tax=Nostoc sp. TaxID=1180 RepID=UPI002FFB9EE1